MSGADVAKTLFPDGGTGDERTALANLFDPAQNDAKTFSKNLGTVLNYYNQRLTSQISQAQQQSAGIVDPQTAVDTIMGGNKEAWNTFVNLYKTYK